MEKKLIGFKRFKSKKGTPLCMAYVATPFSPQRVASGACGCEAEGVFLPDDQYDYLTADDLGKEVTTDYDIVGGRAYLRKFTVDRGKKGNG